MDMAAVTADRFDDGPLLVFWETTKACELACRHCRAQAAPHPSPGELTPDEGKRLVRRLADFPRPPVLVLTGGDVMARADLRDLVAQAQRSGLPVALAPSVTGRLTDTALEALARLGARSVSVSLDGSGPATHEGVRGVEGHFAATLDAMRRLRALGFRLQVNTAVMAANASELADVASLVLRAGATSWEVFFLVHVGRGQHEPELSPTENEDVAHFLWEASCYGLVVRTVEGPWCRRVASWRRANPTEPGSATASRYGLGPLYGQLSARLAERLGPARTPSRMPTAGTRDGKGTLFVGHDGTLLPAGFMPVPLGNTRVDDPVATYRHHPLLTALRHGRFAGRCGACEYADACGGSRARAYAASGDPLGEDPACSYVPA
jgi:radical SAM protein